MASKSLKLSILETLAAIARSTGLLAALLALCDRIPLKRSSGVKGGAPQIRKSGANGFQILLYHRVNDDNDPFFPGMPVDVFRRHMEMLGDRFHVLPLEELVERSRCRDVPPLAVSITFDDGYRDNYANAFPILRRLGLRATIFLSTGALEGGKPLWHDVVFDSFRRSEVDRLVIEGKEYELAGASRKRLALEACLRSLRRLSPAERDRKILALLPALKIDTSLSHDYAKLTWEEIREMNREGISFGAHTVTHPILSRVPFPEAAREIRDSRESIERHLDTPVRTFAYPNGGKGDFTEPVKRFLKEEGFLAAVTTRSGINDGDSDPLELRRLGVWDHDPNVLALRLGWYRIYPASGMEE